MTTQAIEPMTEPEARRITERIRSALDRVASGWADLAERVAEAYDRRAHLALGGAKRKGQTIEPNAYYGLVGGAVVKVYENGEPIS